jgi:hypothetical protein
MSGMICRSPTRRVGPMRNPHRGMHHQRNATIRMYIFVGTSMQVLALKYTIYFPARSHFDSCSLRSFIWTRKTFLRSLVVKVTDPMATKTTPKRKAKPVDDDFVDDDDEQHLEQKKKKQRAKPKKEEARTEPYTGTHGWEIEPKLFLLWK